MRTWHPKNVRAAVERIEGSESQSGHTGKIVNAGKLDNSLI
jgi:hypothetical protein